MNQMKRIITIAGIIAVLGELAPTVYAQTLDAFIAPIGAKGGISKGGMTARGFYNRGVEKHQRRDYRGAILEYNQALRLARNDKVIQADTYFNRGAAYKELGDNRQALTDLRQAAALYQQLRNQEDYRAVQNLITQIR